MNKIDTKKSVFRSKEGKRIIRESYEQILEQWPIPHERRYIQAGSIKTHVIISGQEGAPPLFLLHGSLSNSAAWMGDVETWSGSFRVIAADLPGQPGLSSEAEISPSGDTFGKWFENLVEELGYGDRAVSITGQSLGSFVALKYAVKHPELVSGLSLLTTPGIAPARISFMFRAIPLMLFGEWGYDRIDKMVCYGVDTGAEAAAYGRLVSKHCRPLTEPIPVFSDDELSRLAMPVQYFGGDHDVMLNTSTTAARLKRLVPHAEINILKGIGHAVINRPEILDFLLGAGD